MKRCKECNKLADNGAKRCQRCGTEFEYKRWRMLFSETRIILGILVIALVGWIVYNAVPLPLPDPTQCSETSVKRFERVANNYFTETRNILRSEILFTRELSMLRSYKNEAESIPVHPCLEPAKAELVEYLDDVYFIGLYSSWGAYQAAAYKTESAGAYWDSFNSELDAVKGCLPNCP
jgi:hypothetical protein